MRFNAGKSDPGFTRNTPALICSIRSAIPYPCIGSSASVLRTSISSVPCTRSRDSSPMNSPPLDNQEVYSCTSRLSSGWPSAQFQVFLIIEQPRCWVPHPCDVFVLVARVGNHKPNHARVPQFSLLSPDKTRRQAARRQPLSPAPFAHELGLFSSRRDDRRIA